MITVGPTGNTVVGDVLDVNVKAFESAIQHYDSQLYVTWNPKKVKGWGCWEIRRHPNKKSIIYQGSHQGMAFYKLDYVEFDTVHHVLDCAYLNYDAIRRLKEMDAWQNRHWVEDFERKEEEAKALTRQKAKEALKYALKQNRSMARDFYEAVRSGIDPARILTSTKWVDNS